MNIGVVVVVSGVLLLGLLGADWIEPPGAIATILSSVVVIATGFYLQLRPGDRPAQTVWQSRRVWLIDGYGRAGIREMHTRREAGAKLAVTDTATHLIMYPGPTVVWPHGHIRAIVIRSGLLGRERLTLRIADPERIDTPITVRVRRGIAEGLMEALDATGGLPADIRDER